MLKPDFRRFSGTVKYTVIDIYPNGTIISEAKHGVRIIEHPEGGVTVQYKEDGEWIESD